LSFEGFLYALNLYNNLDVPVPKHFFDYIRYYLLHYYAKQGKVKIELEELKETLSLVHLPANIAFDKLLTLYQFREVVPEEYLVCWDDAILSLVQGEKGFISYDKKKINQYLYNGVKNAYKPIIRFILEKGI